MQGVTAVCCVALDLLWESGKLSWGTEEVTFKWKPEGSQLEKGLDETILSDKGESMCKV